MAESKITEEIVHKDAFQVLGIANYKSTMVKDPKLPPCWAEFFATTAPQEIEKHRAEPGFFGIFINPEIKPPIMKGYYLYLIGAAVTNCKEAPQGMMLYEMPASDYIVLRHPPTEDGGGGIGRLVGYLHSEWKPSQGYERTMDNSMFLEFYPPPVDGKHSNEVWAPIRKVKKP